MTTIQLDGKTYALVRTDCSNAFCAECAFDNPDDPEDATLSCIEANKIATCTPHGARGHAALDFVYKEVV
jgi:hypothetical protein